MTTKQQIIRDYKVTEQELSQLNFMYGNAWLQHPSMYIGMVRRHNEVHYCGECGCRISAREYEDYRLCQRCHDYYYNR